MKASRVSRVIRILTTLQAGKPYTANDLAEMLGISRRTVFRDLKELQAIGVPYHYEVKTAGYTIDPDFFLPPIDLKLEEALSLLLLVHKARTQMQLPFKNSALFAALKIENNLPGEIRQYCDTALKNIVIKPTAQASMKLLDKYFGQLQQAIEKKQKINFRYHSLYEGGIIKLCLSPYLLTFVKRAWYVIGYSSMHKTPRTFKLNRIKELEVTDKCFTEDPTFEFDKHFGLAWSMIPEGRVYNIKLRFSSKVATNVTEIHWHGTQKVTHNSDGSVTVEFRVQGLGEIIWWILGYGDQVRILSPKKLREKVIEVAENMIKLNRLI